jgi:hypothetical protein
VNREQLGHLIRAAATIVDDEIVVAGSQAVLGQFPSAPPSLLRSLEAAVYPKHAPDRAAEIEASLGDGSQFHATYGIYAHGIGPETVVAPSGWQERLVRVEVRAVTRADRTAVGWTLEIHDLILAKLAAWRPHDIDFVRDTLDAELVDVQRLSAEVSEMPTSHRDRVRNRLEGLVKQHASRKNRPGTT